MAGKHDGTAGVRVCLKALLQNFHPRYVEGCKGLIE
jgi:hypothetical protein